MPHEAHVNFSPNVIRKIGCAVVLAMPVHQVQRRHKIGAVLLHCGNGSVVYIGAVLDRVYAGFRCPQNSLCSVSMSGNLASEAVRVTDDCLHLVERVLRCLRIVPFRQHSAGRANLHDVCAVFNDFARLVLHSGNAIGRAL